MSLAPGTRLGPYEVVAPLGAGGMGEVHRARDTRLGREVAIKALPEGVERDPERVARFEREAKLLASLQHPNIGAIFGLEEADGHRYLVLEFIDGETLGARLARGALPLDEALSICAQIATAVEAAHEAGVVHRDLKPANVMIRPDGAVKVLDFGLAKATSLESSSADIALSASPTMSFMATGAGIILGTAAYMSPEQARGKPLDRRTDIWSFGCVLFECLTGQRSFEGETVSDLVARILEREPDWTQVPTGTPPAVQRLLRRCLTKNPRERLRDIGEARIVLEGGAPAEPEQRQAGSAPRGRFLTWAPWVLSLVLLGVVVARNQLTGSQPAVPQERRLEIGFPEGQTGGWTGFPVISPDGRRVVMCAADSLDVVRLWTRSLDDFTFHPLNGTEDAMLPFWSPDSRSIAFFAHGAISRLEVEGGVVQRIVDGIGAARGACWGPDGTILYTPSSNDPIWRVAATGGAPTQVTQIDTTLVDASHRFPAWLPDGKHFLFALWSNNARVVTESGGIYLGSVDGGAPKRISPDMGGFLVLPSGHLAVARNGNLLALPFDLKSFAVGAEARMIATQVGFLPDAGALLASASATGTIAYQSALALPMTDLVWLDRTGRRGDALGLRTKFYRIMLSPDGGRLAASMIDATGMEQLWTADLARRTVSRLTRDQNDSYAPVWSPDGRTIAFNNRDTGTDDLYQQLAAGTRPKELIWSARDVDVTVSDWSADGRYLFFTGVPRAGSRTSHIWMMDLQSGDARVLLKDDFNQRSPKLSPDGHWLAYVSEESGRQDVFVRSFPDLERKWQVSTTGGLAPHWRADGREIIYRKLLGGGATLMSVAVAPSAAGLAFGEPQQLFQLANDTIDLAPAADHSRFLALIQPAAATVPARRIILDWNPERRQ